MRTVGYNEIREAVRSLFGDANRRLPSDAEELIRQAAERETVEPARSVMRTICDNLEAAEKYRLPICQDTGMAVVFVEMGCDVFVDGNIEKAINDGVRDSYTGDRFRCSIVSDPLFDRKNTGDNTPAIIHISVTDGDKIRIIAAPKGFGSENKSAIRMFKPTASEEDVIDFVAETVRKAGSDPCPPIMVGVGIGGDFEKCALLARKSLVRPVSQRNPDVRYAALESKILQRVNELGIGPQGFGGSTTALCVNVEYAPTHIAGLPVAVNINCHVMRHKEIII